MRKSRTPRSKTALKALGTAAGVFFVLTTIFVQPQRMTADAASPTSVTLSPTATAPVTWAGTAIGGGALNAAPVVGSETLCREGLTCDTFTLNVGGTAAAWAGKRVRVKMEWNLPVTDYDLYIHKGSNSGPIVASSGNGITALGGPLTTEETTIDPSASGTGVYTVHAVYYVATTVDQYRGSAVVEAKPIPPATPPPSTATPPTYHNFAAPSGFGESAGEPTVGVNWNTGTAMFISGLQTLRVRFNDSVTPTTATWEDVSAPLTSVNTLDPILFTDIPTGRTFVSQLAVKSSLMEYTDDDGATWTPSQGSGINSGVDHQTVGGGPYARNADGSLKGAAVQLPGLNLQTYPNAIYYASQDSGLAEIARSDNGGLTFGVAIPMWTLVQCGGLHGHIKVAPDGTVYVPNKSCNGAQGVAVSEDNGLTWSIRTVPGSTPGDSDPSVGVGSDGTIYLAYSDGDGRARVAVSHDRGLNWGNVTDIGAAHNLKNSVFPEAIAGDANRAAVFFLGSSTEGANGRADDMTFDGTWFGYVATTYDGGQTWVTVNATPNDPVQRGVICTIGTTCPGTTRNLLDFNDVTVDKRGRAVAAFADGCVTATCIAGTDKNGDGRIDGNDNDGAARATVIRQSGGRTLFAAFD
jgi:hypothetical protein